MVMLPRPHPCKHLGEWLGSVTIIDAKMGDRIDSLYRCNQLSGDCTANYRAERVQLCCQDCPHYQSENKS